MNFDLHDKLNPTGMFSKAGRTTVERYNILLDAPSILHDQHKLFKVSTLPSLSKVTICFTQQKIYDCLGGGVYQSQTEEE